MESRAPHSRCGACGAAFVFALPLLSACGDRAYLPITGRVSAQDLASRAPIDACLLLLRSDVDPDGELGLAKAITLIDESEGPFFAKCGYGRKGPWRYVGVEVRRSLTAERASNIQEESRPFLRRLAREPLVDVPELGDAAVWAGGRLGQLHVLQGDLRLIFTVELGADDERQALAVRLGRLALERLHALEWDRRMPALKPADPPG